MLVYLNHHMLLCLAILFVGMLVGNILNLIGSYLPRIMQQNWQRQCEIALNLDTHVQSTEASIPIRKKFFQCRYCEQPFALWRLLPLSRTLFLKEKCNACKKYFSPRYLSVEIITGLISVLIIYSATSSWEMLLYLPLAWMLILLAIIDSEHYLLPDVITFSLLWVGLFANSFHLFTSPEFAILGAIVGYLALFLVAKIFKHFRGIDGLGLGDCKLFAVFGAWWGINALIPILLIASLTGSAVGLAQMLLRKRAIDTYIPFGPYLALGGVVTIFL